MCTFGINHLPDFIRQAARQPLRPNIPLPTGQSCDVIRYHSLPLPTQILPARAATSIISAKLLVWVNPCVNLVKAGGNLIGAIICQVGLQPFAPWQKFKGPQKQATTRHFVQFRRIFAENGPRLDPNRNSLSGFNVTSLRLRSNLPNTIKPSEEAIHMTIDKTGTPSSMLTHLQRLEAESIHIMREVVANAENPVMLYSVGKDSACMLHLAKKAFYPSPPPFPLLHVDTTWKFKEMYKLREKAAKDAGMDLIVHQNQEAKDKGINPFDHGALHTDMWKTDGLKQALTKYNFDVAFGGARRDEEKSRAKERIFSFRSANYRWDPKNQRPELWKLYNTRKSKTESIRAFPLSNWTELDIWQYIHLEGIEIVPLYFSAPRPVVERGGMLIMVDDERMPMNEGEVPMIKSVRFRTLGCYPLTGAVESTAATLPEVIQEMLLTTTSERQGRAIDHDQAASMEKKKQEGYF
ncbi:MAG: sulfate adenylyltransferase subunit 2 [Pseudorhodobacter sp.]|jgi:sulfate adenylyltransferase subunit 2